DRVDGVVHVDEAHPLPSVAELPAEARAEDGAELGEHAALAREDEAEARVHHADAEGARLERGLLPRLAELREIAVSGSAPLVEPLVAAAPVEAHGRRADEGLGALVRALHLEHEEARRVDAALLERALVRLVEATGRDALAGEVHHGARAVHESRVDLALFGIPSMGGAVAAAHAARPSPVSRDRRGERASEEPRRPGDRDRSRIHPLSVLHRGESLTKFPRAWRTTRLIGYVSRAHGHHLHPQPRAGVAAAARRLARS